MIDDQDDVEDSSSESGDSDQEDVVLTEICDKREQQTTTRSGRTVSRRSETDFFILISL